MHTTGCSAAKMTAVPRARPTRSGFRISNAPPATHSASVLTADTVPSTVSQQLKIDTMEHVTIEPTA
jgi:hypothetical protein